MAAATRLCLLLAAITSLPTSRADEATLLVDVLEASAPNQARIHRVPTMLSAEESARVISLAHEAPSSSDDYHEWQVRIDGGTPELAAIVDTVQNERFAPALARALKLPPALARAMIGESCGWLVVRYCANSTGGVGQPGMRLHFDQKPFTAIITLSQPDDFSGGGTRFELPLLHPEGRKSAPSAEGRADAVRPRAQGEGLVFAGGAIRHGAAPVTTGCRYVLVALADVDWDVDLPPADEGGLLHLLNVEAEHRAAHLLSAALGASRAPLDHGVHNALGVALEARGDLEGAEASLARAVLLAPGKSDYAFNLGNVRRQRADWPGAVECYRRAVEAEPGFADGHANLGGALLALHVGPGRGGPRARVAAEQPDETATIEHELAACSRNGAAASDSAVSSGGDVDGQERARSEEDAGVLDAVAHLQQCLWLDPENAHARFDLSWVRRNFGPLLASAGIS